MDSIYDLVYRDESNHYRAKQYGQLLLNQHRRQVLNGLQYQTIGKSEGALKYNENKAGRQKIGKLSTFFLNWGNSATLAYLAFHISLARTAPSLHVRLGRRTE